MRRWLAAVLAGALIGGCTPESKLKPVDNDFETPLFRRAKEKYELRDFEGAIGLYEEVLRENPNMAKANLELGLIQDNKLGDYVSAIYHYRRFLKLRPDSERARVVKQWITQAELAFAAQQPNSPLQNADELARLQKDNLALKEEIEEGRRVRRELEAQLKAALSQPVDRERPRAVASGPSGQAPVVAAAPFPAGAKPAPAAGQGTPPAAPPQPRSAAPVAPAAAPKTAPPPMAQTPPVAAQQPEPAIPRAEPVVPTGAPQARVHVVAEGETLWRIASKYYPGNVQRGVERIQEANRGTVSDVTKLRVGQQLKVP